MSEPDRSARVRVTAPRAVRRRPLVRTAAPEIDAQTEVGHIFVQSLLRAQLRSAALTLGLLALFVVSLPLLFRFFPETAARPVLGMPLAWVLLAFGIYPVLVLMGVWHVRRSERIEEAFSDVVEGS